MAGLLRPQLASPTLRHALDSPALGVRRALDTPLRPGSPSLSPTVHAHAHAHLHIHAPRPSWGRAPAHVSAIHGAPRASAGLGLGIGLPSGSALGTPGDRRTAASALSGTPGDTLGRTLPPSMRTMPQLAGAARRPLAHAHGALSPDTAGTLAARAHTLGHASSPLAHYAPFATPASMPRAPLPRLVITPVVSASAPAPAPAPFHTSAASGAGASLAARRKARFMVLPTFIGGGVPAVATTPRLPSVRCAERVCTPRPRSLGPHDEWLTPTSAGAGCERGLEQAVAALQLQQASAARRRVSFASVPSVIPATDGQADADKAAPGPAQAPPVPAARPRAATLSLGPLVQEPFSAGALADRVSTPYHAERAEWLMPGPCLVAGRHGVRHASLMS